MAVSPYVLGCGLFERKPFTRKRLAENRHFSFRSVESGDESARKTLDDKD
jgi:hypothetical protein